MAALSIFGYHNISVTDITCTWKSRKPHTNEVQTIDELYSTKPHTSTNGMLSEENILKFKSNLGKLQNAVGFTWLLRSDQAYSEIVADVESIVFSQEFLEVDDKRLFLENALLVTEEVIKEISNKTVGQTSNENW
ncbi:hypothetical protein HHI36_008749 [Cryptolaemus montrouzieri]|uniref:Uncharacterized protein n=1 Tax=Cryptolaemus montrouzieri TaxID=559131 RepID=A0ABD2MU27_9CUCU